MSDSDRSAAGRKRDARQQLQQMRAIGTFGDPTTGATAHALCVCAGSTLVAEMRVPAQGLCAGKPCWTATQTGFRYHEATLSHDATERVRLKAGAAGKAKVRVAGRGAGLPVLPLSPGGLTLPLSVQVQNSEAECWSAAYTTARQNTAQSFKATP